MISPKENKSLLEREPRFDDSYCSMQAIPKIPTIQLKEIRELVSYTRRFNDEVVRPLALKTDLKTFQDPEYLPWDLVQKANEWGFYTLLIPKFFGGHGYALPGLNYVVEELASACVGIANVVFVHYLGFATILASWNIPLVNKICREVAEGRAPGPHRIGSSGERRGHHAHYCRNQAQGFGQGSRTGRGSSLRKGLCR